MYYHIQRVTEIIHCQKQLKKLICYVKFLLHVFIVLLIILVVWCCAHFRGLWVQLIYILCTVSGFFCDPTPTQEWSLTSVQTCVCMWKNGQSFKGSSNLCSCVYNTLVSNHFHCVKNFVFSSAKPRDFDGLQGTGLLVSMYTTKTPIDKWHFNVTQLNFFLHFL